MGMPGALLGSLVVASPLTLARRQLLPPCRAARLFQGGTFKELLQQADEAIGSSEGELHKTLQLIHMERLLRLADDEGPTLPDATRLVPPKWAEVQLPSLERVGAGNNKVRGPTAILHCLFSAWLCSTLPA